MNNRAIPFTVIIPLLFFCQYSYCQNIDEAKKNIQKLTSTEFWGRGYTNNGMAKAAQYIANELKSQGINPLFGKSYFQEFSFPVNTFPSKVNVTLNGKLLEPGKDFIISPESKGIKAEVDLIKIDSIHFKNSNGNIIISLVDKLTWSAATEVKNSTVIMIYKKALSQEPKHIKLEIENKFIPKFKANNVGGVIKGSAKSDSLIVLSAHYDHLGGMGSQTFFPGANDNASGVALLLELMKYYQKNPLKYSVVLLFFAGEEAGLIGSNHFVNTQTNLLPKIKFLINLDLTGTGDEGITVVNASVFKKQFDLLNKINNENSYFSKIKSRGRAANSDHYWFTEKGVPSFFIYTLGGIQAYHDINDKVETLPLTEFVDLFKLIVDFNNNLN